MTLSEAVNIFSQAHTILSVAFAQQRPPELRSLLDLERNHPFLLMHGDLVWLDALKRTALALHNKGVVQCPPDIAGPARRVAQALDEGLQIPYAAGCALFD